MCDYAAKRVLRWQLQVELSNVVVDSLVTVKLLCTINNEFDTICFCQALPKRQMYAN